MLYIAVHVEGMYNSQSGLISCKLQKIHTFLPLQTNEKHKNRQYNCNSSYPAIESIDVTEYINFHKYACKKLSDKTRKNVDDELILTNKMINSRMCTFALMAYFPHTFLGKQKKNILTKRKLCLLPTLAVFLVCAIVFAFIVLVQLFHNNFSF